MKKIPQRKCMGCMESFDKSVLIKIVKTPLGEVVYDEKGSFNGRGAYVCKKKGCINKALKANRLSKTLKCEIPETIIKFLERQAESYE